MHKCGPCGKEFKTEKGYLEHACVAAEGATPKEVDYLVKTTTPNFAKIAESALKRGEEKAGK